MKKIFLAILAAFGVSLIALVSYAQTGAGSFGRSSIGGAGTTLNSGSPGFPGSAVTPGPYGGNPGGGYGNQTSPAPLPATPNNPPGFNNPSRPGVTPGIPSGNPNDPGTFSGDSYGPNTTGMNPDYSYGGPAASPNINRGPSTVYPGINPNPGSPGTRPGY